MGKSGESVTDTSGDTLLTISGLGETGSDDVTDGLTDLSFGDHEFHKGKKKALHSEFERKKLLHDLQLVKIELSQKSLLVDNLKAQNMRQVEELEERLEDALHKKQMLKARLESALAIQEDDSKKRQIQTQKELKIILQRQRELEQTNRHLEAKASNIRSQLQQGYQITEDIYVEMKARPVEELTISEYFSLRTYEALQPLKIECNNLQLQRDKLSHDVTQLSHGLNMTKQELVQEQHQRSQCDVKVNELTLELQRTKQQLAENRNKSENYDSVKEERTRFESNYHTLMHKHSYLEAEHKSVCQQLEEVKKEQNHSIQSTQLLKQDKEYLTRNLSECSIKLERCEDTLQRTQRELEQAKVSREELYEKYAASRDESRVVYERRLQTELDRIRLQTENELEKLRSDTKHSFERENRSLKEGKEAVEHDRDQIMKQRDEAEHRCSLLTEELRHLEATIDSRLSEFQNEARVKTFELDRLQLIHEETCTNLERTRNNYEKAAKKLEIFASDYSDLQKKSTEREMEMKSALQDARTRLAAYEHMEQEMDDIVLQAAEVEDDKESERVLFSYGFGANVPTSSKHRMKQSVQLARRVLRLEKINTSLQSDIQRREEETKQMAIKLSNSNRLLEESKQPYSFLIESMRRRDEEVEEHRRSLYNMEEHVKMLEDKNLQLSKKNQLMSSDLDRLLGHQQELTIMKRVIANMGSPRQGEVPNLLASGDSPRQKQKSDGQRFPKPIVFTKKENMSFNPERYRKMR
uniref:Progesterone immunomodulatory binding factor 1 n=1 Tax=Ciona intestinalis TaxID=7719 RepID=F6VHE0_CIOIN